MQCIWSVCIEWYGPKQDGGPTPFNLLVFTLVTLGNLLVWYMCITIFHAWCDSCTVVTTTMVGEMIVLDCQQFFNWCSVNYNSNYRNSSIERQEKLPCQFLQFLFSLLKWGCTLITQTKQSTPETCNSNVVEKLNTDDLIMHCVTWCWRFLVLTAASRFKPLV